MTSHNSLWTAVCANGRQLTELQEQHSAEEAEIRKLYDWRDVMKTVHNERLQELAAKHQAERDTMLATISHRLVPD